MKLFKKSLSLLLALVMSVSSLLVVMPVSAATDLDNLRTAISGYESTMSQVSSTKMYKGLADAYSAYVAANKAYDAYVYGGDHTINLASYTTQLNNAKNNMATWTQYKANSVFPRLSNDDTTSASSYPTNCLWSAFSNDPLQASGTGSNITNNFYYNTGVYLYDGTDPKIPFLYGAYRYAWGGSPRNPKIYYAALTNSTNGLKIANTTYRGDAVSQKNFANIITKSYYIYSTETSNNSYTITLSTGEIRYMANYFTLDCNTQFNQTSSYYLTAKPNTIKIGSSPNDQSAAQYFDSFNMPDTKFYVINYKALLDKIYNTTYVNCLKNVGSYKENQLANLVSAIDYATSNFSMNNYDFSSNTEAKVTSCASAIGNAVSKFNSVGTPATNSTSYATLRTNITSANSVGDNFKINDNYSNSTTRFTATSYANFSSALSLSQNAMKNVLANGYVTTYSSTQIATIASNLKSRQDALKFNYIVDYVKKDGTLAGYTVNAEDSQSSTSFANTSRVAGSKENSYNHTTYYWSPVTLSRATYGTNSAVIVNESSNTQACQFGDEIIDSNASCSKEGSKHYVCSVCSAVKTETIAKENHDLVEKTILSTCNSQGYTVKQCKNCDYEQIVAGSYTNKLQHVYKSAILVDSDCTFEGVRKYTCTLCGDSYNEQIPVNPNKHNELIFARTVAPTDSENGYDIYYCSNLCTMYEKCNFVAPTSDDGTVQSYYDTYNSALENVEYDLIPYTNASVELYLAEINRAKVLALDSIQKLDNSSLDLSAKIILEAKALLVLDEE